MLKKLKDLTSRGAKLANGGKAVELVVPAGLRAHVRGQYVGALERITGEMDLKGWVANLKDPATHAEIWITINDRKVRKAKANAERLDVEELLPGARTCGFSVPLGRYLNDIENADKPQRIRVFLDDALTIEVPGSPLQFDWLGLSGAANLLAPLADVVRAGLHEFSPRNPFVRLFFVALKGPGSEKRQRLMDELALSAELVELIVLRTAQRGWFSVARDLVTELIRLEVESDELDLMELEKLIDLLETVEEVERGDYAQNSIRLLMHSTYSLLKSELSAITKMEVLMAYLRVMDYLSSAKLLSPADSVVVQGQLWDLAQNDRSISGNVYCLCVRGRLSFHAEKIEEAEELYREAYKLDEGMSVWYAPEFVEVLHKLQDFGAVLALTKRLRRRAITTPSAIFAAFSSAVARRSHRRAVEILKAFPRLLLTGEHGQPMLRSLTQLIAEEGFRRAAFSVYGDELFEKRKVLELYGLVFRELANRPPGEQNAFREFIGTFGAHLAQVDPNFRQAETFVEAILLLSQIEPHDIYGILRAYLSNKGDHPHLVENLDPHLSAATLASLARIWSTGYERSAISEDDSARVGGMRYTIVLYDPEGDVGRPGSHRANLAGLSFSDGDRVLYLDPTGGRDLQTDGWLFLWKEFAGPDAIGQVLELLREGGPDRLLFLHKDRYLLNLEALTQLLNVDQPMVEFEGLQRDRGQDSGLLVSAGELAAITAWAANPISVKTLAAFPSYSADPQEKGPARLMKYLIAYARLNGARRLRPADVLTYIRDCESPPDVVRPMDRLRVGLSLHDLRMPLADIPSNPDGALPLLQAHRKVRLGILDVGRFGLVQWKRAFGEISPQDPVAFIVERNEILRLPFLLDYYRGLGIRRFVVVDNYSDKPTLDFLGAQDDVDLWVTQHPYGQSRWGVDWVEAIIRTFYVGVWCLVVDADELLTLPRGGRSDSVADLCRSLEDDGENALFCYFLDTYSDRPIGETHYRSGQSFLDVCNYIDRKFYTYFEPRGGPEKNAPTYIGGLRERVFGISTVILNKIPLFKYAPSLRLYEGLHWVGGANFGRRRGAILHFKYFSSFHDYVEQESRRGEHWNEGSEYKIYQKVIAGNRDLCLHDPLCSLQVRSHSDLVKLGLVTGGTTGNAS